MADCSDRKTHAQEEEVEQEDAAVTIDGTFEVAIPAGAEMAAV